MKSFRELIPFLRPYRLAVFMAPLLMLVEVAMDLMQPRLLEQIVDRGIAQGNMRLVIQTGLLMVGLALVGAVGGVGNTFLAVRIAHRSGADLRDALFARVLDFSFGNLDRLETGQLVTRLTNDVTQVQEVVLILVRILVRAPLLLVGSLIMGVLTSPRLALLLLALSPFILGLLFWVIARAHPLFAAVQERLDRVNTVMQENLAGVRVVKAFVRSAYEQTRFGQANDALRDQTIQAMQLMALVMPLMMLFVNLGVVGVIWFGGRMVVGGQLAVGQIIAFVNYLLQALFSLMMVGMLLVRVSRAAASADRIVEVLHSQPDIQDRPDAGDLAQVQGQICFEDVTFSYNGQAQPVLQEIRFSASPGETVAILGATGSGKSSLVHLIPRFYDVKAGRVLVDGVDVRQVRQASLRRHISVALQEAVLFTGTIRDNIRYGCPDASEEEVIAAAKAAQIHDFIVQLPEGYDTRVGQRGVNLSGGQKQRIAIARALIRRPAILILDDSTSAVDVETEACIQEALASAMANHTRIIIAQRISSVVAADKIIVLDNGRICGMGTHQELLATNPIYQEIYTSQLGNGVKQHG
ncbi:ABC transporter ATP-binding protein/permease [Litorilinea aerophila]|uniref:ABC transporter ATP-binding protein n=1 Tax=Litorilinea aerophila TaxID=1204385 RepID=A0A540VFX8_9CHLR|nr:ABC transporter ATP-binding protein [Litorilinea aerophila]MCC9076672.1 ABC transporter ATP-binding protein/permease [Litorilinea aerophila]